MKTKIAVTGGSGFIGTNLVADLLSKGFDILNIDIQRSPIEEFNSITQICDIRNFKKTAEILRDFQPDYIVHLAARTDLDGKSLEDYDSNTTGVRNIVEIAANMPNLKKLLVTSSMLVCKAGYQPKHSTDYCPTTLYGESKVETERITRAINPKCDWAFLRPTSIWGPWFKVPYRNFFDMVLAGAYFHIGHKSCTKTYGYIGNAIYQIEQVLFNDTSSNPDKVYYLGDDPTNIEEWATEIAYLYSQKKVIRLPYWIFKGAAFCGDILKLVGISFPMTSFRLRNMTTDNILDLSNTDRIAPERPFDRINGIKSTLAWIKLQI